METRYHRAPRLGTSPPVTKQQLDPAARETPRVADAAHACVGTFGLLAALAAVEHGVGEILQGFRPAGSVTFPSWPDSAAFASLAGEPAMSLVPNLGLSGILSILVATVLAVAAVRSAHLAHAGLVLAGISVALLLAGGGFGPPLLGIILAVTAARALAPGRPQGRIRRRLSRWWRPLLVVTALAYLGLFPGTVVLSWLAGIDSAGLVVVLIALAFGGIALTMTAALTHDRLLAMTERDRG